MTACLPLITEFNPETIIYYCLTHQADRFEGINRSHEITVNPALQRLLTIHHLLI